MNTRLFGFLFFLSGVFFFGQTKEEVNKATVSTDYNLVSDFIEKYPNNPNTAALKKKLKFLKNTAPSYSTISNSKTAKPSIAPLNTQKLEKQVAKSEAKGEPDAKAKRTADVLTHLFSNDPNKKEAYILIRNKSDCNLIVKIEGKKFFNLDVPKKGENYILVPKGVYIITTMICSAKYSSTKNITQDIEINLNAVPNKKAKN